MSPDVSPPPAPPLLLPAPRTVRWRAQARPISPALAQWIGRGIVQGPDRIGSTPDAPSGAAWSIAPASALHPQGYTLDIQHASDSSSVAIRAGGPAGVHHAFATLRQLLAHQPGLLPSCTIEDAPVDAAGRGFPTRGVMLDVSRDKVPAMAQLREAIDLLASLKFNHLQLYTEHTFAYAGHEEVWRDASPITPDEARELDAYAAARGIELAANQNCFGHLASWLKRPAYQHLAEIEGDNPWYFHQWVRRGPFSLCPTDPRSEAFVRDLLGQLLPCFTSPLVNINCDEAFDVGWGRSRAAVRANRTASASERRAPDTPPDPGPDPNPHPDLHPDPVASRARANLYFDFVNTIARICQSHHKRPMMWADIALTHPDLLHRLPPNSIGLAWWYEPTDKFARWVQLLREARHDAWVCPGTSSWRTFTGRTAERRANISDAAEQGLAAGASGFMVCDWGDMGHRQQWPIALAGLAHAAEAAWNPARARAFDPRASGVHALHESADLGAWLEELGDSDADIRGASGVLNASALFNDLHPPVPGQLRHGEHEVLASAEQWTAVRERIDDLSRRRPAIANDRIRAELDHALACAAFAADHAVFARSPDATRSVAAPNLIARCEAIRSEHERLWLLRNRPGGLAHASSFYTSVIDALRRHAAGASA